MDFAGMDFEKARRNMVDCQLRPNSVTDARLLAAMAAQPREIFLPGPLRAVAYADEDLGLGDGRYLMEPVVTARLLQAVAPRPDESALVIGCASAYNAALLGRLAASVVAVEPDAARVAAAGEALEAAGIDNVAVIEGRLAEGAPDHAPFDIIFPDGAMRAVPDAVSGQLAGAGRLAVVLRQDARPGKAMLMRSFGGVLASRPLFDACTPLLPEPDRVPAFTF